MSKRILIVTQYFYPENFRINDLALEFKSRGYEVTVLTGLPNYPKGEYFDGYSVDCNCDESWNGIPIYRCRLRPRYSGSVNLIRNYLSFVYQANRKMKELNHLKFDIIYVFEVSPITVALPAIRLKKQRKIPVIMNVQDLWPENIIAVTGIDNWIINFVINRLVNYIYKHCDLILASSPSFVDKITLRLTDKNRVKYWPQYATVTKHDAEVNLFDKNVFNIVFTGNIGEAQGIDIAIEAAKQLRNENICWHFIGDGRSKERLEGNVKKYHLEDKVKFYGYHPESEIPLFLKDADAALLILKHNPAFEMTIPAKLQTYMSCGVPIVGCVAGESKRIIEEAHAGLVTNSIDTEGLVEVCKAFLNLENQDLEELKVNAMNYSNENFNKHKLLQYLLEKMDDFYEFV